MTSGGPQQGWPGQPHQDPGQPGGWPQPIQPGQPYQQGQSPAWQQGPAQSGPQPYQQGAGQQPYQQGAGQPYQQQQQGQYGQPAQQGYQASQGQGYPQGQPYQQQGPYQQPYQQQGQYGQQSPQGYPPTMAQPPVGQPPVGQPSGSGKKNLPVIITVIVVVVALAAAGLVYWLARKGSTTASGGQDTPKDAVVKLLDSVQSSDPIGIADQLDPTEAHLFADMTGDVLQQLKRLGVVSKDVSADKVTGISVTTKNLKYADSPIVLNDHLQVVELTGGTITLKTGGGPSPYSKKILDAFPELKQVSEPQTKTVNIAKEVADLGHPIRITTVDRDGKWYPSLFYTIADNWAYQSKGGSYKLKPIGDNGGSSPEDAMNKFIDAAASGDPKALISVLSPDEMGVLHDYGNLMIGASKGLADTGIGDAKLSNVSWAVSDVTGGKKVSLKSITVKTSDGNFSVVRDPAAGSLKVSIPGQGTINVNSDNIDTWLTQTMGADSSQIPAQVRSIIKREFSKVIGLGVVMVQGGDGKWYVSPLRSFSDVLVSLLSGLQSGDIDYFLSLAKK